MNSFLPQTLQPQGGRSFLQQRAFETEALVVTVGRFMSQGPLCSGGQMSSATSCYRVRSGNQFSTPAKSVPTFLRAASVLYWTKATKMETITAPWKDREPSASRPEEARRHTASPWSRHPWQGCIAGHLGIWRESIPSEVRVA